MGVSPMFNRSWARRPCHDMKAIPLIVLLASAAFAADSILDIPRIDSLSIETPAKQWREQALQINAMLSVGGEDYPADDFEPRVQIAWNDTGILLRIEADYGAADR